MFSMRNPGFRGGSRLDMGRVPCPCLACGIGLAQPSLAWPFPQADHRQVLLPMSSLAPQHSPAETGIPGGIPGGIRDPAPESGFWHVHRTRTGYGHLGEAKIHAGIGGTRASRVRSGVPSGIRDRRKVLRSRAVVGTPTWRVLRTGSWIHNGNAQAKNPCICNTQEGGSCCGSMLLF